VRRWALGLAVTAVAVVLPAAPASAHPLGNFSVNQYEGLTLQPDRVSVTAVVNTAEVATQQDRHAVDTNSDRQITAAERASYAATTCRAVAAAFQVTVDGTPLSWSVTPGGYEYVPPDVTLPAARLTCSLTAPAALDQPRTVRVDNRYRPDRAGWHELTATGHGVHLVDSPLPDHSISDELHNYPSATLDVRTATLHVAPGAGPSPAIAGTPAAAAGTGLLGTAEGTLRQLTGDRLSPLVVVLAVLLALALGAGHAALPGHGKTVLAAYLAGRAGRPRDAVAVGVLVTLTHTVGVLVAGVLLTVFTALAGERLLTYLGVASGLLVVAVGAGMVVNLLRHHKHSHHDHPHGYAHPHSHDHPHSHGHPHSHPWRPSRWGLAGIGLAGGLVPSPSALLVLLTAVGLGRAAFGVLLVLVYGLGMAATLTGAGLLLVAVGDRLGRLTHLAAYAPRVTAGLVVVVGIGLTVRAAIAL
jgi:ABC-type nickel/cobalt efflux system permease component RcnA